MLIYLQMMESEGDKVKFEQIYDRYKRLMYSAAWQLLHNSHDAEDAVQQAFLYVAANMKKFSEIECHKTASFLVIIVESRAIDILRARKRTAETELNDSLYGIELPMPGDNPLAEAIAKLPERYRNALLMHYDNGYSEKEVAAMLGVSYAAVRKLISRAKEALRKILEQEREMP